MAGKSTMTMDDFPIFSHPAAARILWVLSPDSASHAKKPCCDQDTATVAAKMRKPASAWRSFWDPYQMMSTGDTDFLGDTDAFHINKS